MKELLPPPDLSQPDPDLGFMSSYTFDIPKESLRMKYFRERGLIGCIKESYITSENYKQYLFNDIIAAKPE